MGIMPNGAPCPTWWFRFVGDCEAGHGAPLGITPCWAWVPVGHGTPLDNSWGLPGLRCGFSTPPVRTARKIAVGQISDLDSKKRRLSRWDPSKGMNWMNMYMNARDLVWLVPPTRMEDGRIARKGVSLSLPQKWPECKRCAESDDCKWFNYEGKRCRLFQCRGNTWGRTTNDYAGPKWKPPPCSQISVVLRRCVWFWKGPDGEAKALLFGGGGQNKGADTSILSQPRLLRPIRGWDLDNRRLCLLALPTVFHQCLTSNGSFGNQCFYKVWIY